MSSGTSAAAPSGKRPRFTVASAAYNVARYLDEFIESIEAQTFDLDRLEVIVVDDGSTDDTLEKLRAWENKRPGTVRIFTKENGGQSTARNYGLERATGEWITFTDPDDVLDPIYFAEVDAFLRERPATRLVATNRINFADETRKQSNHPLHKHFTKYNRLRNLDYDTNHFHGHSSGSFFLTDEVRRQGLTYDEELLPTFEDGYFTCHYLLDVDKPLVGYLATAIYHYRKRGDATSTLERSWAVPGRFITMPERGYLRLLEEGAKRHDGRPPRWIQGMVIYELSWFLKASDQMYSQTLDDPAVMARFHGIMDRICALLDAEVVEGYDATKMRPELRDILLHAYAHEDWHTPYTYVDKLDMKQRSMRLAYRFTGKQPDELFIVDGAPVEPLYEKIRGIKFFDEPVLHERIVWLPYGTVRVVLNGVDMSTRMTEPGSPTHFLDSWVIRTRMDPELPKSGGGRKRRPWRKFTRGNGKWTESGAIRRLARTRFVRHYFRNAWVLMDRIMNADDSAEHLFRWLRKNRPGVNAWFVIEKGTPDYERLRKDGHRRVVPHGSLAWKLLMCNAQHLISTHIDHPITRPSAITRIQPPRWRFTFLQHGVIKDDISNWLNGKNIDIFVTSTPGEQESIAGYNTPYRYTTREAHMTGLPRFDKIRAEGQKYPPNKRDLILVAPTWRQWLILHKPDDRAIREVNSEQFESSQFAIEWLGFLKSDALRDLAERTGLRIALLMHPNLQTALPLMDLPPYIEKLQFEGNNVQALFARARTVITDYSSMAFNAAYIDRPLVYFQFDHHRMFGGGHLGRRGYFQYERDGFGPVVTTADEAVAAVVKAVDNGPDPEPEYAGRIAEAFPQRDGKCCERTADAIAASTHALEPQVIDGDQPGRRVRTPLGEEPAEIQELETDEPAEVSAESVDQ